MRDFLLNSEELLDRKALGFLQEHGEENGLFSCLWIHFNERVKLAFFTDGKKPLSGLLPEMELDDVCSAAQKMLAHVRNLETAGEVSLENVIWDPESIYLDGQGNVFLICLPAAVAPESVGSDIYKKRIYALLEDLVSVKDGGDFVCRQIEYQQQKAFGDWENLSSTLSLRAPEDGEDDGLTLKSINTPRPYVFRVGHDKFKIGTDPGEADGLITGVDTVDPVHALIGWNGINYFVRDLGSEKGTFVNDQKIAPDTEVPIGEGTVLRFADCTFNVE